MGKNIRESKEADALFQAILNLKNIDECYKFFDDLCTIAEMSAMIQRYAVANMLTKNMTYTEIENKTGASTATISRINRALLHGEGGYMLAIERSKKSGI